MFTTIVYAACAALQEADAKRKFLDTLPKDQAAKIIEEDKLIAREKELHKRRIEIAEAGRPRNFWGK